MTPRMGVVLFAFGVARVPPGGSLPGAMLMRLLGDLGLSAPAGRAVLLRMRREGLVISTRQGRRARYRLTPSVSAVESRLERQLRGQRPPWDGTYAGLLYEVPEAHRAFRDRLRRAAQLAGYGILRPGLLIAPTDRSAELAGVWDHPPPGAQVLRASLGLSTGDASRVAAEVWGLDALAGRYRSAVATARAAVDQAAREPHVGRQALVALAGILQPVYDVAADDPDLPRELLPPGWPGDQVGLAVGSALRTLGPAVAAYVEGLGAPYRTSSEGTIRREKGQPVVKHSSPATSASTS